MSNAHDRLLPRLRKEVKRVLEENPQCHGWDHTLRVWRMARHLAEVEGADRLIVDYAALLHDIGRAAELAAKGRACHAVVGAERLPAILRGLGVDDPVFVARVASCVRTHRYRKRDKRAPATIEAKVVFDADKLDSIGAIGTARALHFAGRIGARVHNTQREALRSASYSREDTAYREFLVKLRHLPASLLTGEGKRIAAERYRFMCEFFERLDREVKGADIG